jgi:tetratricopeptide (TPR) repeat protein
VLAVVNFEDGEYQKAIPHLLITETVEVEPLLSKLLSGWAYRRVSMYDMAEDELRLAIEKAAEALSDRVMAAPPSADVRSAFNAVIGARTWILGLSLAEVLVRAWMELACSYAERDADLPEEVLNVLPLAPVVIRQMDDELARRETEALYHGNLGWILFKQGRENEAVAHLRRSISLEPDAEMYLRLALVLETKLSSYPPSERKRRVVQIERYLDHVPELDRIGEYGEDVRALRQRLQAMVPTPPNGQVARAQLSRATR